MSDKQPKKKPQSHEVGFRYERKHREKSILSDKVRYFHLRSEALKWIVAGHSQQEAADHLNISRKQLRRLLEDSLATLTTAYQDFAEQHRTIILRRLENLYQVAESNALGRPPLGHKEADSKSPVPTFADPKWAKIALEILREELKLVQPDFAAFERSQVNINVTNVQHQTIAAGDDLYNWAQERMEESWLGSGESGEAGEIVAGSLADMTAADLIDHQAVNKLTERVEKLSESLPDEE